MAECLILKGGGGTSSDEVTALKQQVLVGTKTITKDSNDEIVEGTMPNRGAWNARVTNDATKIAIPQGHHDGSGYVESWITNLNPGTILSGRNIGGVVGTATNDAVLPAHLLVSGYSGYDDGNKVNGTMPNRGNWGTNIGVNGRATIPEGYHSGGGSVGQSIAVQGADVPGTDRAYATGVSCWAGTMNLGIRNNHYINGVNWIQRDIPELQPGNIRQGVNIGGLVGTMPDYSYLASGQVSF